ncbi:MAG: hypothetical protein JXR73_12130 [Candidatus Omnitrophica bacterium]|nr:hypothetical protein [Candidatus Omnitrophota bacterium]
MDAASTMLSVWHAPFIFSLLPKAAKQVDMNSLDPLFWKLYAVHLALLAAGSLLFCALTQNRIQLFDE